MFNISRSKFFNPRRIWFLVIITTAFLLVTNFAVSKVNEYVSDTYVKSIYSKLEYYYKMGSPNKVDAMCIIANCTAIVVNTNKGLELYVRSDMKSKLTKFVGHIPLQILTKIRNENPKKFVIGVMAIYSKEVFLKDLNDKYTNVITYSVVFAIVIVFFTLGSYLWLKENYKQRELKENLEDHIQKGLTESLHHEIGNPVQGLWNVFLDYVTKVYPCYTLNDFREVPADKCLVCKGKKHKTPPADVVEMIRFMKYNFERITSVLKILSKSKHVKYSHESINLKELLDLTISSKEKLHISKVKINLEKANMLEDIILDNDFENGLFVNIINSLLTNSIEANANEITITPELIGSEDLNLYIKDNGHGVLDKDNNLFNSEAIFKYGYSSKDDAYNKLQKSWFTRFKNSLFFWEESKTTRGFGLSINRDMLKYYEGNLILFDNSYRGATFRMSVKIKKEKQK